MLKNCKILFCWIKLCTFQSMNSAHCFQARKCALHRVSCYCPLAWHSSERCGSPIAQCNRVSKFRFEIFQRFDPRVVPKSQLNLIGRWRFFPSQAKRQGGSGYLFTGLALVSGTSSSPHLHLAHNSLCCSSLRLPISTSQPWVGTRRCYSRGRPPSWLRK